MAQVFQEVLFETCIGMKEYGNLREQVREVFLIVFAFQIHTVLVSCCRYF